MDGPQGQAGLSTEQRRFYWIGTHHTTWGTALNSGHPFWMQGANYMNYISYLYTAYFQLPPGLSCDGISSKCVMQWRYTTGNSCKVSWTPADPKFGSTVGNICGAARGANFYPEEVRPKDFCCAHMPDRYPDC